MPPTLTVNVVLITPHGVRISLRVRDAGLSLRLWSRPEGRMQSFDLFGLDPDGRLVYHPTHHEH